MEFYGITPRYGDTTFSGGEKAIGCKKAEEREKMSSERERSYGARY
jgi:hypothetical protein